MRSHLVTALLILSITISAILLFSAAAEVKRG